MHVSEDWNDTPQTLLLDDHLWEGDPLMDAVVGLFDTHGAPTVRKQFETALDHGIDAVDNPFPEVRELFAQLDRIPDWYDAEASERGRLRLAAVTAAGKFGAKAFGYFATAMEQHTSASVGSTGRIARQPARRLVETSQFFEEVTYHAALERRSPMFGTIVRVRLMHALVRRGLRKRWGAENFAEHGMPIPNTNMAGGSAWFATMPVLIDAAMGRPFKMRDLDDIAIHWGYILYLFGVHERIIPLTGMDSIRLADHHAACAGEPSPWRTEIVEGLIDPTVEFSGKGGPVVVGLFAGSMTSLFGPADAATFFDGTKYSGVNRAAWASAYEAWARASAMAARAGDHVPAVRERRASSAAVGDPFLMKTGTLLRKFGADHGIETVPFTHHDQSTSGSSFAPIKSGHARSSHE
ncbi:oxygenase MpaB family protein [Streptomyces fuscichromogenes]|nr:oxygenase MpaB family protein [Streptomyces fuscichromogenes]